MKGPAVKRLAVKRQSGALLKVEGLEVNYGKVRAVRGVSLRVDEGELVAVIGANGAGKSSTLNAICGIVKTAAGRVTYDGEDITGLPSHQIIKRGIVQVPEGRMIFAPLSVKENLRLGAHAIGSGRKLGAEIDRVMAFFPDLRERMPEPAANLSGGQLQMLALARGLMARPRLLLLDEPALGLAPLVVRDLFALIPDLRDEGITILLVEQNVRQVLGVVNRGYVLEGGKVILGGTASELMGNKLLVETYLGILETPT